jgi:hypothetical protein
MAWWLFIPDVFGRASGGFGPRFIFFALGLGEGKVIILNLAFNLLLSVLLKPPANGLFNQEASGAVPREVKEGIQLTDYVRTQRDRDLGFWRPICNGRHRRPLLSMTFGKIVSPMDINVKKWGNRYMALSLPGMKMRVPTPPARMTTFMRLSRLLRH